MQRLEAERAASLEATIKARTNLEELLKKAWEDCAAAKEEMRVLHSSPVALRFKQLGCAKVNDKLIQSLKSRNNTFVKRTKGLKKKASELATLCGVDLCMICVGPQGNQECKPMIWPDDSQEFSRIIKRYQGTRNEEKDRRKLDLMGFLKERNKKPEDELNKTGSMKERK